MRLLPIYLLAFAAVVYGQQPGAPQGRGGVPGGVPGGAPGQQQAQQRPQLTWDFNNHEGWQQLFDGRTLDGWDGPKSVWRVENGVIVGESTVEHPSIWWVSPSDTGTAWLLRKMPKNFEFRTEIKLGTQTTNSGIQFRAIRLGAIPDAEYAAQLQKHFSEAGIPGPAVRPNLTAWENRGYQGDFTSNPNGSLIDCCMGPQRGIGQTVRENKNPLAPRREGTASRGNVVRSGPEGEKPELIGTIGDPHELASYFKAGDWNQVEIIADGNVLMYVVNGHVMSVWIDDNQKFGNPEGEIALQLEGGGRTEVEFRNIWLKTLP